MQKYTHVLIMIIVMVSSQKSFAQEDQDGNAGLFDRLSWREQQEIIRAKKKFERESAHDVAERLALEFRYAKEHTVYAVERLKKATEDTADILAEVVVVTKPYVHELTLIALGAYGSMKNFLQAQYEYVSKVDENKTTAILLANGDSAPENDAASMAMNQSASSGAGQDAQHNARTLSMLHFFNTWQRKAAACCVGLGSMWFLILGIIL